MAKRRKVWVLILTVLAVYVGLSALLTTTMEKMADTVALLKKEGYSGGIMVGGAVVTPEFAQELGVHYSSDAAQAVTLAKALVGLK